MTGFVDQYLVNIEKIINNPPSAIVGVFAQNLYEDATKLVAGNITGEQFNANGYLESSDNDSAEIAQGKRSLNYIKDRIFKAVIGYYETAKYYEIPNEVKMNKEELVKLYGANKKFYARNGIVEQSELENLINVPFGLQYYSTTTIVAVDTPINVENFIELL